MKILTIHPGQTFSVSDVYEGLVAGLEANGCEVVRFEWSKMLQMLGSLVIGSVAGGVVPRDKASMMQQFTSWLAAADSIAAAVDHEVDAAVVVNGLLFPPERAAVLRRLNIPVACYGTEAPYTLDSELQFAPYYTHWFTQERTALPAFQAIHDRAFYLPMAYNPKLHHKAAIDPDKAVDAVFVGGGFPERRRLLLGEERPTSGLRRWLRSLLNRPTPRYGGVDWTNIEFVVRGTLWHLDLQEERRAANHMERAVRYAEHAIANEETAAWHRSAKIAINLHRQMTRVETPEQTIPPGTAESLGPRAYEIPASGGFMLCDDDRPEIRDVYGEGAATFKAWDADDLSKQLRYWLRHPDERERRRQLQYAAVQPHSWTARAKTILETITA